MASFVTEILSSAGKLEKEDLTAKIQKLSKHVENVKNEVQDTLENCYLSFHPSLNETMELSTNISSISNEVQSLTNRIENEIKTQLHSSTGEIQGYSKQLQELTVILKILEKILNVKNKLELTSQQLQQKNYTAAAVSLETINVLLRECKSPCQNKIKIFKVLNNEYHIRREKLIYDLGEIWNEHVVFAFATNKEEGMNSVELKICIPSKEKVDEITSLLNAMHYLKYLDHKLKVFANTFMTHVCIPLMRYSGEVQLGVESKSVSMKVVMMVEDKVRPTPTDVFSNFKIIFDFLNKTIMQIIIKDSEDVDIKLMRKWGSLMSKNFCDVLIKDCLSAAIPCEKKDLDKFNKIIAETSEFQDILVDYGFLSEDEQSILAYARNVDALFANKMCQGLLEKARSLMMQDLHITYDIEDNPEPDSQLLTLDKSIGKSIKTEKGNLSSESKLNSNTFKLPPCKISWSTKDLVGMAYEILHDATSSAPLCAMRMFYTVRKMFELYYDVVPVFHQENLDRLPQQSALHHNNCMYIAHHLLTMGHQFNSHFPEPLRDNFTTFVDLVPRIRKSGTEVFLAQMRTQKKILFDIIREIGGFQNMANETVNFMENIQRALKQCLHQLSLLQRVWQDILPMHVYSKAIGTLLNSLLEEIISQITNLEDIPSDCTEQLIEAFGILTSKAPSLFKVDSQTETSAEDIHCFVPKWMKFQELILVLGASLKEIQDRWANGKGPLAHEFSVTEVKQMIRALFQNTDRRAELLAKIK